MMMALRKIYRYLGQMINSFFSTLRILNCQIKYPSLQIDFSSYISAGVDIISADGATCEIKKTHFAKGVYVKVERGATLTISESYVGAYSIIVVHNSIEIMPHCSIGEMVVIRDQNHKYGTGTLIKDSGYETGKIPFASFHHLYKH